MLFLKVTSIIFLYLENLQSKFLLYDKYEAPPRQVFLRNLWTCISSKNLKQKFCASLIFFCPVFCNRTAGRYLGLNPCLISSIGLLCLQAILIVSYINFGVRTDGSYISLSLFPSLFFSLPIMFLD